MPDLASRQTYALVRLRGHWALFLAAGVVFIGLARGVMGEIWLAHEANLWFVLACASFVIQMGLLWGQLPLNVRADERLAPSFGPGTWLSLVRLLALALLAGFLLPGWPPTWLAWAPLTIYLAFNLLDLADGLAARLSGTSTVLGAKIDIALDGAGVLAASLLAVHYGTVGWWYLLVGAARYIFLLGLWQRERRGLPFEAAENRLRRPLAGVQMGITTALLAPGLPETMTNWVAFITMLPFLANFAYDWLVGSRRIVAASWARAAGRWQPPVHWLLLGLRIGLAALAGLTWLAAGSQNVYAGLQALFALGILLGIWTRPLAFALLVATGLRLQGAQAVPMDQAVLLLGLALLYVGGGRFVLLAVRDVWIFQRIGEVKG